MPAIYWGVRCSSVALSPANIMIMYFISISHPAPAASARPLVVPGASSWTSRSYPLFSLCTATSAMARPTVHGGVSAGRRSIHTAVVGAAAMTLVLMGCGTETAETDGGTAASPTATESVFESPSPVLVGVPMITWDDPIPDGKDVTKEDLGSLGLPFDPVASGIPGVLVTAQVSLPGEEYPRLGMLYELSMGKTTSADPRVVIYEQVADMTQTDLEEAATGGRELVTVGATPGLLVRNGEQGGLIFMAGGVRFDVTGPSLSIHDALVVGEALEAEASRR